jgi:hypothetical protein
LTFFCISPRSQDPLMAKLEKLQSKSLRKVGGCGAREARRACASILLWRRATIPRRPRRPRTRPC